VGWRHLFHADHQCARSRDQRVCRSLRKQVSLMARLRSWRSAAVVALWDHRVIDLRLPRGSTAICRPARGHAPRADLKATRP
jgi:hypothetical protein